MWILKSLEIFVHNMTKIKGCEIVSRSFCPSYHLNRAVLLKQQLSRTQLAVVVVSHREAVGAGIVNNQNIADVNFRQHSVNCKLIIILAKSAGYVIFMVAGSVFLAQHRYVMIRTIHCRSHKIAGTGVNADILLVDVLLMNALCYKMTVRRKHTFPVR